MYVVGDYTLHLHLHLHITLRSRTRRGLSCFCNWQNSLQTKVSSRPPWIGKNLSSPELVEKECSHGRL